MKKVVFFDFFGVICSEIAPIWFRKYFDDKQADMIKSEIVSLADIGLIDENEMYQRISKQIGVSENQIAKEWRELVHINDELVEYIKQIKQKYPVYLLSNAIASFLRPILKQNDLYQLFDEIFISSEMKIAKPDSAYFETVLKKLEINANDVVMIDDNPSNINGAKKAGIDGIVFQSNQHFKQTFGKYFEM